MIPIRLYLLLTFFCLTLGLSSFSQQSMSNTDAVLTLNNTCINAFVTNGPYNVVIHYTSDGGAFTINLTGAAVVVSNGVMTITGPANSFPTPGNDGYYSLPDTYNGDITLTSGSFATYMNWALKDDYTDEFNCVALPVWFNSFSGSQSGATVVLNWQTGLEQNTTFIEIYRASVNSTNSFYKIGQVAAAGNSEIAKNYTFTDLHACGTNYYFLKMLNSQGTDPIFSSTISVGCTGCTCTLPTPVNCPYTISGLDHICNLESGTTFTLSSAVPDYSTIFWSVDNPSAASLHTYPGTDRNKVTMLKKAAGGGVTLTATLSGCSNAITKYIIFGTPAPTIGTNLSCPNLSATAYNSPGATNYEWHVVDATTYAETITNSTSPNKTACIGGGHTWNIGFQYTNVCGVSVPAVQYGFVCTGGCNGPHIIKLSPNPSNGLVAIGLEAPPADVSEGPTTIAGSAAATNPVYFGTAGSVAATHALTRTAPNAMMVTDKPKIYQVKVVDGSGTTRKSFSYPQGETNVSVNLSGLINGIYTIQVFDNKTWSSSQFVLAK